MAEYVVTRLEWVRVFAESKDEAIELVQDGRGQLMDIDHVVEKVAP